MGKYYKILVLDVWVEVLGRILESFCSLFRVVLGVILEGNVVGGIWLNVL